MSEDGPSQSLRTSADAPMRRARSSHPVVVFAAIALVVGVAGVAGAMVLGDDDDGIDGSTFSVALAVVLDGITYSDGSAELPSCPFGSMDELVTAVDSAVALDQAVIDGMDGDLAYQDSETFPASVSCNRYVPDEKAVVSGPNAVSFSVLATPTGSYGAFLTSVFDNESVSIADTIDSEGGVVYPYCIDAADENGQTGCGADWVDADAQVSVGVYLGGDASQQEAIDALDAVLPVLERQAALVADRS